jgi:hypothetical protein
MLISRWQSVGSILVGVALWGTTALAQTTARVTSERAKVYASDFSTVVTIVPAGTALEVISHRGDWYEVRVNADGRSRTGFVYGPNVEPAAGADVPDARPEWTRRTPPSAVATTARADGPGRRRLGVFGFGQFGYSRIAAAQTFNALFGSSGGAVVGAGGELRFGRLFLDASIDRLKKTGHRVFVADDGTVFQLGTSDVVTLTPIAVTAGWRFEHEHVSAYFGGGISRVLYRESSEFADASEDVNISLTGYQALGGIEVRNGWVATAFELVYSRVPETGSFSGAAAAFHEANVGGIAGRVKVLVGR